MFRDDVLSGAVINMPVPALNLDMRTVVNLTVPMNWGNVHSRDLPNLELEYKDKSGDTLTIWYNIKNTGRVGKPYQFDEKVMEFAERVGKDRHLELVKRSANSATKGIKSRIKDLGDNLYAAHLGSKHMVDSIKAPRILRCQNDTTTFRAFRYVPNMKDHMRQQQIHGITGFFKMGDEIGYFIIDGIVAPLRCPKVEGMNQDYIISDVRDLMMEYRDHIMEHWPFLARNLGIYVELATVMSDNHHALNRLAGEHFFKLSDQAGDLKPRQILGLLPSRNGWSNRPAERWHNVTAMDIANQFCSGPSEYQKFLNRMAEEKIAFNQIFQVDILNNACSIYLTNECSTPIVIIEKSKVVA